ncbi:MAG: YihY/virulence factor BrkB family protein [Bacillota bacterium]
MIRDTVKQKALTHAKKPWQRVTINTAHAYFDIEISRHSAALTYYFIFGLFPALILVSSLVHFLNLDDLFSSDILQSLLPADVLLLIETTFTHMADTYSNNWYLFSLGFSLYFIFRAIAQLLSTLNQIYKGQAYQQRWLRVALLGVAFIVFIPVYAFVLVIGEGFLNFLSNFFHLNEQFIYFWQLIRFTPLSIGIFLLVVSVYTMSLTERISRKYVLPGAFLATTAWLIFSLGFVFYVDRMGRYSMIYGSIGTIIAFLVWLYVSLASFLCGAVFNQCLREELEGTK